MQGVNPVRVVCTMKERGESRWKAVSPSAANSCHPLLLFLLSSNLNNDNLFSIDCSPGSCCDETLSRAL